MSKNSIQIHHRGEFEASNQLQFCAPRTIDDDRSHHPIPGMKRKEGSTKEGRRRRRRRCKFLSAMITPMIRISKEVVTSAQKSYSIHPPAELAAVRPPVMRGNSPSYSWSVGGTRRMQEGFVPRAWPGRYRGIHFKGHSHYTHFLPVHVPINPRSNYVHYFL